MPLLTPLRRGLIYFCLHTLSLAILLAVSKLLMEHYSFGQVVFLRVVIPFFAMSGWIAFKPSFRPWRSPRWKKHLLRGAIGFLSLILLYLSVKLLPLSLAMTMRQLESFFWVGLAAMLYGEKVSRRQWAGLVIGFAGVVLVMRPAIEINFLGTLVTLSSAVVGAFVRVLSRDLSQTEDSATIIFFNFTQWTLLSSLALPWVWSPVAATDWWPILITGFLIMCTQWLMTEGMALVPGPRLAPFRHTEILWAGLLGWLIWQEPISSWFMAGSILIIAGGIAANWKAKKSTLLRNIYKF